jgi:hypothetical protein
MHRLVVVGRWEAVEADVAPLLTRDIRGFQDQIRRDGIRKVREPGALRHDCPVSPSVDADKDCFVYRLEGRRVVPIQGVTCSRPATGSGSGTRMGSGRSSTSITT